MKGYRSNIEVESSIRRSEELLNTNRVDEAIVELKKLIGEFDHYADLHNKLGLAYSLKGFYMEAIDEFRKAILINPGYIEAHLNLSIIYQEMGFVDKGEKEYKRAGRLEKEKRGLLSSQRRKLSSMHMTMGEEYEKLGMFTEAVQEYKNALRYNSDFLDVRNRIAMTMVHLQDFEKAIEEYHGILKINPAYYEARFNLGYAFFLSGERAKAKEIWDSCLQEHPDDERLKVYLKILKDKKH
jgi:tetratricopeptide (TPR) repeat protein